MKDLTKMELLELRANTKKELDSIVGKAEVENRKLNETEDAKFAELTKKLEDIKAEEERRSIEAEKEAKEQEERNKNNNQSNIRMKENSFSIVKEIRSAIENGSNKFTINSEMRAATVGGFITGEGDNATQHDTHVMAQDIKPILEPLYAESVINKLGCTIYNSLPQGEIVVPIMSKNTVGWVGEIAQAGGTQNEFTTVTLRPKRLSAYIDISKMLIASDCVGVENAIRKDIVKALQDTFEKTILGNGAKTDTKPAGLFYNADETTITTYANLCDFESDLEDKGISGEMKYILNPKAKSYLRQLAKSSKVTELVYQNGEVDGTPAISTSLVPTKKMAYGSFQDFIVGLWDNLEVTVDPYS